VKLFLIFRGNLFLDEKSFLHFQGNVSSLIRNFSLVFRGIHFRGINFKGNLTLFLRKISIWEILKIEEIFSSIFGKAFPINSENVTFNISQEVKFSPEKGKILHF
jgi:hypothetical protein